MSKKTALVSTSVGILLIFGLLWKVGLIALIMSSISPGMESSLSKAPPKVEDLQITALDPVENPSEQPSTELSSENTALFPEPSATALPALVEKPSAATASPQAIHKPPRISADYTIKIISPLNKAEIAPSLEDFEIKVAIEPALKDDDSLQIVLDDLAVGKPQKEPILKLDHYFLGEHKLEVQVLHHGVPILISEPILVHQSKAKKEARPQPN